MSISHLFAALSAIEEEQQRKNEKKKTGHMVRIRHYSPSTSEEATPAQLEPLQPIDHGEIRGPEK